MPHPNDSSGYLPERGVPRPAPPVLGSPASEAPRTGPHAAASAPVYLRPNAVVEPLVNHWYAWPYLIAPATAPMYVANLHMRIMESFVASPQVHMAAVKNPAMLGGPFMNHDASKVDTIRELIARTAAEQAPQLEFADAVVKLSQALSGEASGYSLRPLYDAVPEPLRGYVELVYDTNNAASIRFLEGLLYKSRYYNPSAQSLAVSLVERDDRPFVFSTPRLPEDGQLHVRLPFRDEAVDLLFRMKEQARPLGYAAELLGLSGSETQRLSGFFTDTAPRPGQRYAGDGVRMRYYGHATVLLETRETSVLTDPVVSYQQADGIPRYTLADLPDSIDYVLITHAHQDHCMLETLLHLRHKVRNILVPRNNGSGLPDPSLRLVLEHLGFRNVQELDELATVEIPGGAISTVPFLGEHGDLNIRSKTAYLVELLGKRALFSADSNALEPRVYDQVREIFGDLDALFLGMECEGAPMSWMYGPLLTRPLMRKMDQSRRLDASDAASGMAVVERLKPRHVYIYAMGQEPWLTYVTSIDYNENSKPIVESNLLLESCRQRGIPAERLFGRKEVMLG